MAVSHAGAGDCVNALGHKPLSVARLGRVDEALKEIRDVRKVAMQHYATSEEIMTYLAYSEALIDLQGEKWSDAAVLLNPITQELVKSHRVYLAGDEGLALLNFAKACAAFGLYDVKRASTLIDSAAASLQKLDPPDFLPVREAVEFMKKVDATKAGLANS